MVKKLLKPALAMLFMFLLIMNTCVYADDADDDYELLYHLNIVGEDYAEYQTKNNITENEFLRVLVRFVTEEDVSANDAYEYALSRNIISKTDTREIGSAISYERSLSLVLNVLGYAGLVEFNGQDTDAVMKLASENKLMKGIDLDTGDRLNGRAMLKLLSNAAEAKIIDVGMSHGGFTYKKGNETLLEAYRDIKKITARVTDTTETSLYGEGGMADGRIGIDGSLYYIDYEYSCELIGQTVYAYIQDDTVLYVTPRYNDVDRIEIPADDIVSVESDFSQIHYEVGEREKNMKLAPALVVIYNGKNYAGYTAEDLMPQTGKIVGIDHDRDGKFDIVFVYSYETMVVKSISTLYGRISNKYDTYGATPQLDLSDDSMDIKIYRDDQEVTISSITVDSVLSVAMSKGKDPRIRIYIGTEEKKGTVGALNINNDTLTVTLDGTEYGINAAYADVLKDESSKVEKISLGAAYECFFDVFGNIAFAKSDRLAGYEYVFLLRMWWDKNEETAGAKIMTVDGDWESLNLTEKVLVNEQSKSKEAAFYTLDGANISPQVALIKRDDNGKIRAIKTAEQTNDYLPDKFTKAPEASRYYWSGDNSFNCRHYVRYDTVVFVKPTDSAYMYDTEKYDVTTVGYFRDWARYTYIAYNVDEFGYPGAIEVKDRSSGTTVQIYVNKVVQSINEDGDVITVIEGNYNGIENLRIPEKPGSITASVKKGDIVDVRLSKGRIVELTVNCSALSYTKKYKAPPDDSQVHDGDVKIMGDVVAVDAENGMIKVDCQTEQLPVYIRNDADIEIFDKDEKVFKVGTVDDIYADNHVWITMGSNKVNTIVVFQ